MSTILNRTLFAALFIVVGASSAVTLTAAAEGPAADVPAVQSIDDSERSQCDGPGKRGKRSKAGKSKAMMKAMRSLDLTEAQQAELDTLKTNFKAEHQALKASLGAPDGQRRGGLTDEADREAMHARIDARAAAAHAKLDFKLDVLAILTPEQREELKASLKAQRQERRSAR